jgi:MFS family permease
MVRRSRTRANIALFTISSRDRGLVNGIFSIGALIGCILGGRLSAKFGRRKLLIYNNLVVIAGCLLAGEFYHEINLQFSEPIYEKIY